MNHLKRNKNILCSVSIGNNNRKFSIAYEEIKDVRFKNYQFGFYSWIWLHLLHNLLDNWKCFYFWKYIWLCMILYDLLEIISKMNVRWVDRLVWLHEILIGSIILRVECLNKLHDEYRVLVCDLHGHYRKTNKLYNEIFMWFIILTVTSRILGGCLWRKY